MDDEAEGVGGDGEAVGGPHLVDELPHGLVLVGAGQGLDQLLQLHGGGSVRRVLGAGPVEEPERLRPEPLARAEHAEHQLRVHRRRRHPELVQRPLHVEVALHDVRDVMHRREVVVLRRPRRRGIRRPSAAAAADDIDGGAWRGSVMAEALCVEGVCANENASANEGSEGFGRGKHSLVSNVSSTFLAFSFN